MPLTIVVKAPKNTHARVTQIDHELKDGEPATERRESFDVEGGSEKSFSLTATRSFLVEEYTGDPRLGQAPDPLVGQPEEPPAT